MLSLSALLVSAIMVVQGYMVCERGKYGEHCNLTCPQNCAFIPPSNLQYCNRNTGKCSEGCQRGWHGDLCEIDCNMNCPEKTCNQQTGHCTLDCNGTTVGVFCNVTRECGRGWYGDLCQHPCSIHCLDERCNHTTGSCILGCSGTHSGEFCNTTKVVNNKEDANSLPDKLVPVVLIVVGAILTGVVILTGIVFLRMRGQTKSSRSPEAESSEVESCMTTDDVEEVLRKIRNNYRIVKNTLETHGRVTMSGAQGGREDNYCSNVRKRVSI